MAGKEQQELQVHSDILSQSETLAASFNGPFKETAESLVKLEEWEVETVTSVVQWFYTRDYRTPLPAPVRDPNTEVEEAASARSAEVKQPQGLSAISKDCGGLNSGTEGPPEALRIDVPIPAPGGYILSHQMSNLEALMQFGHQVSRSHANGEKIDVKYTYTTTLMCHAKVYALADYLLLSDLKKLAYKGIDVCIRIIETFGLDEHTIKDVVTLARYAYAHTNDHKPGDADNEEPLRKRISTFIAANLRVFRGPHALELEHAGGELVQDIFEKVRQFWEADKAELARIASKRQMEEDLTAIRNDAPSKRGRKSGGK